MPKFNAKSLALSLKLRAFAGAATSLLATAVLAADAPLFAAPSSSHSSGPAGSGSIGQVTLALAAVLAFVFVAAWAMRHLRKLNVAGTTQQLQVVAQVALGSKERAVLIRVNDMQVLVGVAPGQITALHAFPVSAGVAASNVSTQTEATASAAATTSSGPSFQSLLKKSLGLGSR